MEKTGMTRRIDELGRLVIPKEIRNNLKIKENDQVEINVIDNKIILNRYENINNDRTISILLDILKKTINKNILFTSRNIIINYALCSKEIVDKNELSSEIMNIINNRKEVYNYEYKNRIYNIIPLIINGDLYGSLIIYNDNTLSNSELPIIKYSQMFLEKYLE